MNLDQELSTAEKKKKNNQTNKKGIQLIKCIDCLPVNFKVFILHVHAVFIFNHQKYGCLIVPFVASGKNYMHSRVTIKYLIHDQHS